jgi:hypothetical protein
VNLSADAQAAVAELQRIGGRLLLDGEKVIVDWPTKSIPAIAERLRAAKTELRAMLADVGLPGDEPDCSMRERLNMIDAILRQRDARGRINYTASQIEACAIGLRRHAGTHPDIDAMLHRLNEAAAMALGWRELVKRWRG